jgi:hypothetical protein
MSQTVRPWLGRSLVVAAAALSTGCANESFLGPDRASAASATGRDATGATGPGGNRAVDLGACAYLGAPEGSKLVSRVYAKGVQIYHWTGTGWSFDGPSAVLSADPMGRSVVGTHYAGPTWESNSGGKVVGTLRDKCTTNPDAVPWLSLDAVSTGPGIFHRVKFIQRVNTVGGIAPSNPGSTPGEEARVPYTTEYLFYRTQ